MWVASGRRSTISKNFLFKGGVGRGGAGGGLRIAFLMLWSSYPPSSSSEARVVGGEEPGRNEGASGLNSEVRLGDGLDPIVAGTCPPFGGGSGRGILNPIRGGREADVVDEPGCGPCVSGLPRVLASPRVRTDRSGVGAMPRPSLSTD